MKVYRNCADMSMMMMLDDVEDPLEGHPRFEKIRLATCTKGNVQIALDRKTNKNVAIKCFQRGSSITNDVRREIMHHAELHHVNVVSLYHVFLTSSHLCIALELGNQNLWQYVHARGGRLSEVEAQSIFVQIIEGVAYCHSNGVANRDIKLENCLVKHVYRNGAQYNVVKICDFGYCKNVEKDSLPDSLVGTAAYLSVDVLTSTSKRGYDAKQVDIWSCGVLLYFLLLGQFPFGTELTNGGRDGLWQRIKSLDYDMNNNLSFGVQDLLSKIFCPAELRISLETIQDHWWVRRGYKREDIRKMKKMHLEESRHPSDRQTQQELYHLIEQALIPPKHMLDEIDDFMQF